MLSLTAFLALMGVIGAVVGGISSLGTTAYNAEQQQQANEANIAAAERMQQQNQAFNRQSAEIANAETRRQYWDLYSPQAKVSQLKQAGLSVGLMYGGSGLGGGGSTAAQAGSSNAIAPTIQPTFMQDILGSMIAGAGAPTEIAKNIEETKKTNTEEKKVNQDIKESNQRIKESNANIKKIIAEAQTEEERKIGQTIQNRLGEIDIENEKLQLEFNKATNETKINIVNKEFERIENEVNILKENLKQAKIETKYAEDIKQETLQNIRAQRNKFIAETYLSWMKAQTETAQKALLEEQKNLVGDQRTKLQAETTNVIKTYEKIENEIREGEALADIAELDRENYKLKMWISAAASGISAIGDIISKIKK